MFTINMQFAHWAWGLCEIQSFFLKVIHIDVLVSFGAQGKKSSVFKM